MNKSLILTGMMGVGKSTVGKELSKKLGYKFIDMDNLIEKKENMTITKIFRIKGENYKWVSLKQIKKLALKNRYVNPFVKTILFIL